MKYFCYLKKGKGELIIEECVSLERDYEDNPFIGVSVGFIEGENKQEVEVKARKIMEERLDSLLHHNLYGK